MAGVSYPAHMTPPYRRGDRVAFLSEHHDGLRVTQATVTDVTSQRGEWFVSTSAGVDTVNGQGEGRQVVPLDPEVGGLIEERGPTFVLRDERTESVGRPVRPDLDARVRTIPRVPDPDPGRDR